MTEHAVVIAGGGPTGLMLAGELAWVGSLPQRGLADALTTWCGPPTAA